MAGSNSFKETVESLFHGMDSARCWPALRWVW